MFNLMKIKNLMKDVSTQTKSQRAAIEEKKKRREYLLTAPLSRDEYAEQLCKRLDAQMNDPRLNFVRFLSMMSANYINKPLRDYEHSQIEILVPMEGVPKGTKFQESFLNKF